MEEKKPLKLSIWICRKGNVLTSKTGFMLVKLVILNYFFMVQTNPVVFWGKKSGATNATVVKKHFTIPYCNLITHIF